MQALDLKDCQVDITLVSDRFMAAQNQKFLGKKGTTDVLSFPSLPPQKRTANYHGEFLGDVLLSLAQAEKQAKEQNTTVKREILFLLLHSLLHLIGHDHAESAETKRMQGMESRVWRKLLQLGI